MCRTAQFRQNWKGEYKSEKITSRTLFDKSWIRSIYKNQILFGGEDEPCDFGLNLNEFAGYLKADADLIGYFVAYTGQGEFRIPANKALNLALRNFISTYKIPRTRLKILNGGNRKSNEMELWLMPKELKFSLKDLPKID